MYRTEHNQPRKSRHFKCLLYLAFGLFYFLPLTAAADCGNNSQAKQLSSLIRNHSQQHRVKINCHPKLSEIARLKVGLLSQEDIIMHNIGYLTPNQLLRENGFQLSKIYPVLGNQVEAIAAGNKTPEATFKKLLKSSRHRNLLLGLSDFYREQNQIGVAYLQQKVSPFDHYWVIYLADNHRNEKPEPEYTVSTDFTLIQPESINDKPKFSVRERHEQSRHTRPFNNNR